MYCIGLFIACILSIAQFSSQDCIVNATVQNTQELETDNAHTEQYPDTVEKVKENITEEIESTYYPSSSEINNIENNEEAEFFKETEKAFSFIDKKESEAIQENAKVVLPFPEVVTIENENLPYMDRMFRRIIWSVGRSYYESERDIPNFMIKTVEIITIIAFALLLLITYIIFQYYKNKNNEKL